MTSSRTTRACEPRTMAASLSARWTSGARAASPPRQQPGLQHHPGLEAVVRPSASWPSTASRASDSALDRKPDLAAVDAQDGHVDAWPTPAPRAGRCRRRPAPRARPCRAARATSVARSPACDAQASMPRTAHQPSGPLAQLERRVVGRVEGEPDALHAPRTRHAQAQEQLVVARRARRAATRRRPGPPGRGPRACSRTRSTAAARSAGSRTTPPGTSRGRQLELGLDHGQDVAARRGRRRHAAQQPRERDERHVGDRERHGARAGVSGSARVGVQAGGMGPLHRHHAGIAAQRLRQLSAAHVESIDARRAALQQTVGEAARGRAHVEADPARRVDPERVERARPASRRPATRTARRRHELHGHGRVDQVARLAVEPGAVTLADAHPAGHQQRLGAAARRRQAPFGEQLVQTDARRHPAMLAGAAPGSARAVRGSDGA